MALALSQIIADSDAALRSKSPESIIISCHAAPIIAIGRILTGLIPGDPTEKDFNTYTCSVSKFRRDRAQPAKGIQRWRRDERSASMDWRDGINMIGGWTCELNASVEHLPNGGERNW